MDRTMPRAARAAALALIPLAGPVAASPCAERIDGLSGRVRSQSAQAISASTGGQGAAAKRGGEGVTETAGDAASPSPQAPPEKSAEAGKGAEAAQQAKVALDEARTADAKGDAGACEAAVARTEAALNKAP